MSESVSIFDVAKSAGVSICTASRAINGKTEGIRITQATRQRVLAAARQLGYHPDPIARDAALGKPFRGMRPQSGISDKKSQIAELMGKTIGVIVSAASSIETLGLIPGIEMVLEAADYRLVTIIVPADPTAARERITRLLSDGADGILCCPSLYQAVSALADGKSPVIVLWQGAGKAIIKTVSSGQSAVGSEESSGGSGQLAVSSPGSERMGNSATSNLTTQQPGPAKTETQSQAPHPVFNVVAAVTGGAGPVTSIPVSPPLVTTIPVSKPEPIIHETPKPMVSPTPPPIVKTPEEPVPPPQAPESTPPVSVPEVAQSTPEDQTSTPEITVEPTPLTSDPIPAPTDGTEAVPPEENSLEMPSRQPEPIIIEPIPAPPPTPVLEPPPIVKTPEEPVPPPQAPESTPPVSVPEVAPPTPEAPTPTPVLEPPPYVTTPEEPVTPHQAPGLDPPVSAPVVEPPPPVPPTPEPATP